MVSRTRSQQSHAWRAVTSSRPARVIEASRAGVPGPPRPLVGRQRRAGRAVEDRAPVEVAQVQPGAVTGVVEPGGDVVHAVDDELDVGGAGQDAAGCGGEADLVGPAAALDGHQHPSDHDLGKPNLLLG